MYILMQGFILQLTSLFLKFELLGSPEIEMSQINVIYKNSLPSEIFYFIHFLPIKWFISNFLTSMSSPSTVLNTGSSSSVAAMGVGPLDQTPRKSSPNSFRLSRSAWVCGVCLVLLLFSELGLRNRWEPETELWWRDSVSNGLNGRWTSGSSPSDKLLFFLSSR